MAYSKTPTTDTYSTQRVNLFRAINARDGGQSGKDEDYFNLYLEPIKDKETGDKRHFVVKRPGTVQAIASVASSDVRGGIYWPDEHKLLYCVGRNIYVYNADTATSTTLTNVFTTSTGMVGMCSYLYDTGSIVICATDGTTLVTIDSSNTVTTCVDADLPVPHKPNLVFIDGYLLLVKAGTADIYNSNLNDPLAWTAGDFISAEMDGDRLIRIAKLNNYLLAFGTSTIEYFWDAGIATGSPFQRNDTPIKINSYLGGFSQYGNDIYYIGSSDGGQPDIFHLKDFKIESVGSPTISRYLSSDTSGISTWAGNIISTAGHSFYIVNVGTTRTYVYDIDSKLWFRWGFKNNQYFDIIFSSSGVNNTTVPTFFSIGDGTSTIYKFVDTATNDAGVVFKSILISEANDFGSMNRKTMSRASIIGDRPATDANVLIQWSDDDYKTFNAGLTTNMNQDLPSIWRLGSFRQRIFKLTFEADEHWRIQELEVNINKGIR